jgi:hypothetical protein
VEDEVVGRRRRDLPGVERSQTIEVVSEEDVLDGLGPHALLGQHQLGVDVP